MYRCFCVSSGVLSSSLGPLGGDVDSSTSVGLHRIREHVGS